MPQPVTEWEFTADAASRINELIQTSAIELPFARAKVEQRGAGSRKRRDITILGRDGAVLVTGEVKMPWSADGHSPFADAVCRDARSKAMRAGSKWYFTWNVNELVLWVTPSSASASPQQPFRRYQVATISRDIDLDEPYFAKSLGGGIASFVLDLAKIVSGEETLSRRAPDDYFIESLESFLERPIQVTFWALVGKYKSPSTRESIDRWMLKDQGWTISDDETENLRRVARATTYALANKLVFYEALRKKFGALPKLSIPARAKTGEQVFNHLIAFFARARDETRDYETVFGFESNDLAARIPFYSETGMDGWRSLVDHVERFDFSELHYDVIGRIFERLIGPEERHKYGQYYTRPEVVDLINSFCIPNATSTVLDPACGGGTFLVRAYARKRLLAPHLDHQSRLSGTYGIDVSPFAAQLTTINLAARELVEAENYPRVIHRDFFDVRPGGQFMVLPGLGTRPGRESATREISIEPVDAVVGNPPYVRQEDIARSRNGDAANPRPGTKEFYRRIVQTETGVRLSGRSDLHCYFWGHASAFLKPTGRLGFLTSSQWLDVEYGFPLQRWLLENFRIAAILESRVEPWFVGARVATTITIACRESNRPARDRNTVRFVELRRPLADLILGDGTSAGMIETADVLRERIMTTVADRVTGDYRIRLIPQHRLWADGLALGQTLAMRTRPRPGDSTVDTVDDETSPTAPGEYLGGKWGIHLRAPDVWLDLIDNTKAHWTHLSNIADIRYGLKTGADDFFYIRDVSGQHLGSIGSQSEFFRTFGVSRDVVKNGKITLVDHHGQIFAIESEYLKPVVLSQMDIVGYRVTEADCTRRVLMVNKTKRDLHGTHVLRYIRHGEDKRYHLRPTCSARVVKPDRDRATKTREWYDLTDAKHAPILWIKERQYRHSAPINPDSVIANCRLYEINPDADIDAKVLAGVLNSTLVLLSLLQYGRPVGVEGSWSTMVIDACMMLVPDPRRGDATVKTRICDAMDELANRKALSFLSDRRRRRMALVQKGREVELSSLSDVTELDQPDRRALDDAVLEMIGISDSGERAKLIEQVYQCIGEYFEEIRRKEEEAIRNKKRAVTASRRTSDEIADELLEKLKAEDPRLLSRYRDLISEDMMADMQGLGIPASGRPEIVDDMLTKGVRFATGKGRGKLVQTDSLEQAKLIAFVAAEDGFGRHDFFPVKATLATKLHRRYAALAKDRSAAIRRLVEGRTADPDLQEQVVEKIRARLLDGWK